MRADACVANRATSHPRLLVRTSWGENLTSGETTKDIPRSRGAGAACLHPGSIGGHPDSSVTDGWLGHARLTQFQRPSGGPPRTAWTKTSAAACTSARCIIAWTTRSSLPRREQTSPGRSAGSHVTEGIQTSSHVPISGHKRPTTPVTAPLRSSKQEPRVIPEPLTCSVPGHYWGCRIRGPLLDCCDGFSFAAGPCGTHRIHRRHLMKSWTAPPPLTRQPL